MHGTGLTTEYPVQARFCAKSEQFVFVVYDGNMYKLTGLALEDAKTAATPSKPPTWDKSLDTKGDTRLIKLEDDAMICKVWDGDGYDTKHEMGGYDLKNFKATGCG